MLSGYYFFLGYLPLPITPAALSISTPSMNKTLTLVNEGEINIPKKAGLREISFDFLLPQVTKYPFSHYQIDKYTATLWMEYIKLWKELNWPFMFIVVRMTPKGGLTNILGFTCIKCVIEDFTFDEDADSLGLDVQCSIKLKEYRDYGTKRITLEEARKKFDETYMQGHSASTQPKQATVTKTRSSDRVAPSKTTIQKGETLATANKRATGKSMSVDDIFGGEVDDPEWKAILNQPSEGATVPVKHSAPLNGTELVPTKGIPIHTMMKKYGIQDGAGLMNKQPSKMDLMIQNILGR